MQSKVICVDHLAKRVILVLHPIDLVLVCHYKESCVILLVVQGLRVDFN